MLAARCRCAYTYYAVLAAAVAVASLGVAFWDYSSIPPLDTKGGTQANRTTSATAVLASTLRNKAPLSRRWHSYRQESSNINACGQSNRNSSLGPDIDCSGVAWPKQGPFQQKFCPWPSTFENQGTDDPPFINFTAASARRLLRGRSIVLNGDSTSRRLMWSLCNFLADDQNKSNPHQRTGDGCCGTMRIDIHCNLLSVLESDILIEYNAPLRWDENVAWLNSGSLSKAYDLRNHSHGLPGFVSDTDNNTIPAWQMPKSKEPRSVHIFHPVAATWHQCLDHGSNWTEPTCGLNRVVKTAVDDREGTVCGLVADFCPRFLNASQTHLGGYRRAPVHMHGLTNVLAYRPNAPDRGDMHRFNSWMLTVARAIRTGIDNRCTPSQKVGVSRRKYLHEEGISCGFHDQTTWMSAPNSSLGVRMDCMPSDGWQGIHIYNEYGQLMRVQHLLNSILRAEEGWGAEAERIMAGENTN